MAKLTDISVLNMKDGKNMDAIAKAARDAGFHAKIDEIPIKHFFTPHHPNL